MPLEIYELLDEEIEIPGDRASPYLATRILDVRNTVFWGEYNHERYGDPSRRMVKYEVPPDEWKPVYIEFYQEDVPLRQRIGDFMDRLEHFASERAREALAPVVDAYVDWFPVVAKDATFYWMRPRTVLDALDGPFDPCCQTVIPDSRQKTTVIEMLPVRNGEEWSVEERASVDVIGDPTSVMRYHAEGSEMQMRLPNAARGLSVVVAGGMVKGSRRGPAPLCWAAG